MPAGSCGEEGSGQCPLCGGGQCTGQHAALHAVHDHQNYSPATIVTLHLAVIVFVCVMYNNTCIGAYEPLEATRQLIIIIIIIMLLIMVTLFECDYTWKLYTMCRV